MSTDQVSPPPGEAQTRTRYERVLAFMHAQVIARLDSADGSDDK